MSWSKPNSKYGMNIFRCDYPHYVCGEEFRTASTKAVLVAQLQAAGWSIVVRQIASPLAMNPYKPVESLEGRQPRIFLCPGHRPTREMEKRLESG